MRLKPFSVHSVQRNVTMSLNIKHIKNISNTKFPFIVNCKILSTIQNFLQQENVIFMDTSLQVTTLLFLVLKYSCDSCVAGVLVIMLASREQIQELRQSCECSIADFRVALLAQTHELPLNNT